MNLNKVILCGRLANDIELKTTNSGNSVASFSLATSRSFKDKSGTKQEQVQFHKIIAWNKTAEALAQYAIKGQELLVTGRLENRSWEDKDGVKKFTTEVILEEFQFGSKPQSVRKAQEEENNLDQEEFVKPKKNVKARTVKVEDEEIPIIEDGDEIDVKDIPF